MKLLKVLIGFLFAANAQAASSDSQIQYLESRAARMADKPTLYIQCELRTAMDCETLRRAYFDRLKVIERKDDATALIRVRITDEEVRSGTLIHAQWSARTIVDAPLPDLLLRPQYDAAKIQSELIELITRPVVVVVQMEGGSELVDLVIESLKAGSSGAPKKPSPYYAEIDLEGSAKKSGIGALNADGTPGPATSSANGTGSIELNRTTLRTRISAAFSAKYAKESQPGDDGSILTAENLSRSFDFVGVYSINKTARWNVALIVNQYSDPGSNVQDSLNAQVGLEYNLVPFRVDQPYEFRIRAGLKKVEDHLVIANDRGNTVEDYYSVGAQLYTYWLILKQKASITGGLSARKNVSYRGYYSGSANLSFSYQITSGIAVNATGKYSYVKKSIDFPAVPDFSNPLQTQYLSGYSGGSYSTSLGVSFNIGRGSQIRSRDRRFK